MFDPSIENILRSVGWDPARQVDVSAWKVRLEREGFQAHSEALRLLSSIGGLEISSRTTDRIVFNPLIASGEFDRVEKWQQDCDDALFPLGEVLSHYIFFIGVSGRTYAGRDEGIFFLGATFEAGFKSLYFENGGSPRPCKKIGQH